MPTVPKYTTNRNLVRTTDSSVRTLNPRQAGPRNFGGYNAQYKSQIANTVNTAGNAFMQYSIKTQDRKDRIIVRNKLNAARGELREFATNVYDSKDMNSSLDAYGQIAKRIEDIRKRELENLDNDSQIEYFAASYDTLSQAHLKHAWAYQEGRGRTIDLETKKQEIDVYHRDVRFNPDDEDLYQHGLKSVYSNELSINSGVNPLEKARKDDKEKKAAQDLIEKYGIEDEVVVIKREPASKDDKPFYSDKEIMNASEKRLSEMDDSRFTARQKDMLNEKALEKLNRNLFQKVYYEYIVPATEFAQTKAKETEEALRNFGDKLDEKIEENKLKTALDKGRSIPSGLKYASRKATIQASNLMASRIFGVMEDKKRGEPYKDALRLYDERKEELLPTDRLKVFKAIRLGLNKETLKQAEIRSFGDERPLDQQIAEIKASKNSPEIKKKMIESVAANHSLVKKAREDRDRQFIDGETTKILKDPTGYQFPNGITEGQFNKLYNIKRKAIRENQGDLGIKKKEKSDPIKFNEYMSMSDEEKANLDYSQISDITLADQRLIRNSIGKDTSKFNTQAKTRIAGVPDLNPNSFEDREYKSEARRRQANFYREYNSIISKLPATEKTPEKLQKIMDEMLLPKKVSTGIFGSKIVYAFELKYLDEDIKEKAEKAFFPQEDLKNRFGEGAKINVNTEKGRFEVTDGALLFWVDIYTGNTIRKFRKKD